MARALSSETLHATSVAIGGRAVLLSGPSGSGKSDLALRLIDRGAKLVSDDYTLVKRIAPGQSVATAPDTIAGKMEVRGLGILPMPHDNDVPVALIVYLIDQVERMPVELTRRSIAGVDVPVARIAPFEASAPIKVELALKAIA